MSWHEDYDYPMSGAFWRDAKRLHGEDAISLEEIYSLLQEIRKDNIEIKELILSLLKEKIHHPKPKQTKRKTFKGVPL